MRKRILILLLCAAMVMQVPIAANAAGSKNILIIDPKYVVHAGDAPTVDEMMPGTDILKEGAIFASPFELYLSLDGGEPTKKDGLLAVVPECDADYWLVENVVEERVAWINFPIYTVYLKQAYPLTFRYADAGTNDYRYFTFANSTECSNVSDALPQRAGYTFLGWYTAPEGGEQVYNAQGSCVSGTYWNSQNEWIGTTGLELYAHWSANSYEVTLDANEGRCDVASVAVVFDAPYGQLPVPERDGYTFSGWYTEKEGGTKVDEEAAVTIAGDHTLYARWGAQTNTITMVVHDQYGSATAPESAATNERVYVAATPNDGCRLDKILVYKTGDPTLATKVDQDNSFIMPAYPVTVEVVFAAFQNEITLTNLTPEYGACSIDKSAAGVGDTVTITALPNKGCHLESWTVTAADPAYTVTVAPDGTFIMPPCGVTVEVRFTESAFTITVETPDAEKGTLSVDKSEAGYGEQITVTVEPAEGYAVRAILITDQNGKEWAVEEVFSMPDSDISVKVIFMVIPTYTVTIPATVELNGQPMSLSLTNVVMESGVNLQIIIHTDLTVRTLEGAQNTYNINDGAFTDGSVVLWVDGGGTPQAPKSSYVDLYFKRDAAPQYSGNYTGTISFTIRLIDTSYEYQ